MVALASDHKPMYAGQCVLSIIRCLATCADLVESIQAERERSMKMSSWMFWKRLEISPEMNSQAEKARVLCYDIVDGATQLGQACEHRRSTDPDFDGGRFKGV